MFDNFKFQNILFSRLMLNFWWLKSMSIRKIHKIYPKIYPSLPCKFDHPYCHNGPYYQSHYREVPNVSNGGRHNWKCFLTYKIFGFFFPFFLKKMKILFKLHLCNFLVLTLQYFQFNFFCPWKLEKTGLKSCS